MALMPRPVLRDFLWVTKCWQSNYYQKQDFTYINHEHYRRGSLWSHIKLLTLLEDQTFRCNKKVNFILNLLYNNVIIFEVNFVQLQFLELSMLLGNTKIYCNKKPILYSTDYNNLFSSQFCTVVTYKNDNVLKTMYLTQQSIANKRQ